MNYREEGDLADIVHILRDPDLPEDVTELSAQDVVDLYMDMWRRMRTARRRLNTILLKSRERRIRDGRRTASNPGEPCNGR